MHICVCVCKGGGGPVSDIELALSKLCLGNKPSLITHDISILFSCLFLLKKIILLKILTQRDTLNNSETLTNHGNI